MGIMAMMDVIVIMHIMSLTIPVERGIGRFSAEGATKHQYPWIEDEGASR